MMITSHIVVAFVVVSVCVVNGAVAVARENAARDGYCGDNVQWSLKDGTLTIWGDGPMKDYNDYPNAPWYKTSFRTIDIGSGVTSIGNCSFATSSVSTVNIPDTVEVIGAYSFYECANLDKLALSKNVKTIGDNAFSSCTKLESVELEDGNMNYRAIDGVLYNHDLTAIVLYPAGKPNSSYSILDGVTTIGGGTFCGCKSLESVTIPDSVVTIGSAAFYECENLLGATIPEGVTKIAAWAFGYCRNLQHINIPDGVTVIEEYVFYKCQKLQSVTIPTAVTMIEKYAFLGCASLKNITIPQNVIEIGSSAFCECESMTDVYFEGYGNNLKRIGQYAFATCDLTSFTIPDNLSSFEGFVLYQCFNLKTVFYQGSKTFSSSTVFSSCRSLTNVCVSPDYKSPTFCGWTVNNTAVCEEFQSKFDHCLKGAFVDGKFVQQERSNVTEWRKSSTGCVENRCDATIGKTTERVCNSSSSASKLCLNDICVEEWEEKPLEWLISIEVENITVDELDMHTIIDSIEHLTGIQLENKNIGIESNNDGEVTHIVIQVPDEQVNQSLYEFLEDEMKQDCPQLTVFCPKKIDIYHNQVSSSSSSASVSSTAPSSATPSRLSVSSTRTSNDISLSGSTGLHDVLNGVMALLLAIEMVIIW